MFLRCRRVLESAAWGQSNVAAWKEGTVAIAVIHG